MDIRNAVDAIWEDQLNGIHCPADWRGKLSIEEGYRVQLGILERHIKNGESQAGWKVGLTAEAIQNQVGYHEQVFGFLLNCNHCASGDALHVDDLIHPMIEPELCLTVGVALKGPGITAEEARAAISAVAPAVEIVERRGDFVADIPLSMADNVQQKHFVTGEAMAPLPHDLDLSTVVLEACVNGQVVEGETGEAITGGPAGSVAWLANRLSDFGRKLEPGMRIMSGSFTRQIAIDQGDLFEARFSSIGSVSVEFK